MNRVVSPDGYSISYEPNSGTVLNLVTRVLNAGKPVTIFCSEVARTTEHLARMFTDDVWLQKSLNQTGWDAGWPAEFQILFSFRFGSLFDSHLKHDPEIVAWRAYIA